MYHFIQLQYRMNKIDGDQVRAFAPQWITEEEAEQILGGAAT